MEISASTNWTCCTAIVPMCRSPSAIQTSARRSHPPKPPRRACSTSAPKDRRCSSGLRSKVGACLSIPREPRWQGEGADARRAAQAVVVTTGKQCNVANAPPHGSDGTPTPNGCARANGLANPSGPGRLLGSRPRRLHVERCARLEHWLLFRRRRGFGNGRSSDRRNALGLGDFFPGHLLRRLLRNGCRFGLHLLASGFGRLLRDALRLARRFRLLFHCFLLRDLAL